MFVELQRFLGILLNFETTYYGLIQIAEEQINNRPVPRRDIGLWSCRRYGHAFPDAVDHLLGLDPRAASLNVPGVQTPAPFDSFRQYWHVRDQWMHHAGILDSDFRTKVPALDQLGWFDDVPDDRTCVIGVNSASALSLPSTGAWQALPLEQVVRHVNGMAQWLCTEAVLSLIHI